MIQLKPRNIDDMLIAVTDTATLLYPLVDTASTVVGSQEYYGTLATGVANCISIRPQDGNIRVVIGATPTTTKGFLMVAGTRYIFTGEIATMKLVRVSGAATVACDIALWVVERGESVSGNTDSVTATLAVEPTIDIGNVQTLAATSSVGGTIAATNGAGGTTIIAANANRAFAQLQNNGGVDVYFGAGTVTSSFPKVVPNGLFTWNSIEAVLVLSSGGNCNIAFIDYTNS